jgi:hypothetical protein
MACRVFCFIKPFGVECAYYSTMRFFCHSIQIISFFFVTDLELPSVGACAKIVLIYVHLVEKYPIPCISVWNQHKKSPGTHLAHLGLEKGRGNFRKKAGSAGLWPGPSAH